VCAHRFIFLFIFKDFQVGKKSQHQNTRKEKKRKMFSRRYHLLVALFSCFMILSLFVFPAQSYSAFTLIIPANKKTCFYERLVKGDRLDLSFQVAEGGNLDIDFWVR